MKKKYEVCIERKNGTTYYQQFEVVDDNVKAGLSKLKKLLGKGYKICGQPWEA